jgi:hypothetical protein
MRTRIVPTKKKELDDVFGDGSEWENADSTEGFYHHFDFSATDML